MLVLGQRTEKSGNVTTLNWVGARPARDVERNLGFGFGRLRNGYWIIVLKQSLGESDFEFDGTTLRSGGREGLPARSAAFDASRFRIHDRMMSEYGEIQYRAMQRNALSTFQITGSRRIVKVLADTPHDELMSPAVQYPAGGGGLQWRLVRDKSFLVALHVDANGVATTPDFSASIADGAPYEGRHKIHQWLATA